MRAPAVNNRNTGAEGIVVACVLIDVQGETLDLIEAVGLPLDAFTVPKHRTVVKAAIDLHKEGKASDLCSLNIALSGTPELAAIGGVAGLSALADKTPTTAHAKESIALLKELQTKREIAAFVTFASELTDRPDVTAEAILDRFSKFAAKLAPTSPSIDILARMETHRRNHAQPPERAPAVLTLAGVPVATAGNLTTILAQAKSGKTALVGALTAACIASDTRNEEGDFLSAKAGARPAGAVVLLLDTEQDPCDHHLVLDRAARRAGVEVVPDWVHAFTLVGTSPTDLRAMLRIKLKSLRDAGTPVWFVVMDGIADFVNDPNSLEESQALITELLDHAAVNACPILTVIHRNEGRMADETARGHIGKQLARKAAFNLILDKDADEVTTVYATQNRGAPILRKDGPRFAYNVQAGMHMSVATAGQSKEQEKANELREIMEAFMAGRQLSYAEIKKGIVEARGCSERTAERHIAEARKLDVLRTDGGGNYALAV